MALGCQGLSLLGDAACVLCPRQPVAFGLSGPRGLGLVLRGRWAGRRWLEGLTEEPQQRTPQAAEEEPPAPTCGASESVTAVFSADLLPGDHGPLRQEEHAPGGVLPARAQVREPRRARPVVSARGAGRVGSGTPGRGLGSRLCAFAGVCVACGRRGTGREGSSACDWGERDPPRASRARHVVGTVRAACFCSQPGQTVPVSARRPLPTSPRVLSGPAPRRSPSQPRVPRVSGTAVPAPAPRAPVAPTPPPAAAAGPASGGRSLRAAAPRGSAERPASLGTPSVCCRPQCLPFPPSLFLFRLGLAPQIHDLYGKVKFTGKPSPRPATAACPAWRLWADVGHLRCHCSRGSQPHGLRAGQIRPPAARLQQNRGHPGQRAVGGRGSR